MNPPPDDSSSPSGIRVVAVTPTGFFSGAERVLLHHALAGLRAGDDWTVLAPAGTTITQLTDHDVPHVVIPELKLGVGRRWWEIVKLGGRILRSVGVVRRAVRDADVVISNSVLALPAIRLARPTAPVLWLVHDVITRPDLARVARWTAPIVARSVPVSRAAGVVSRELGIPTTVVYNGVDAHDDPLLIPAEPPIIGLNAILTEWKGQHVLLEAVARVDLPCAVELMGGSLPHDADYAERLRSRAERPDLAGRVRLLGHCSDTRAVMRRWTLAVSASVEPEAGPLSILEAMALALPVVVSDHGAAPEMVGACGRIVPVADPDALAAAITALLLDPAEARLLGEAGRERMQNRFERSISEREFRAVVHEVAAERR